MPLHNLGYRSWDGHRTPQWSRWWIIANSGITLAFKSRWVRRLMFFAWLPVLYWGIAFFILEQTLSRGFQGQLPTTQILEENVPELELAQQQAINAIAADRIRDQFAFVPSADKLAEAIESGDDVQIRNKVWNWLLMTFFRYPQATLILFLVGFIAPGLISRDVRSRAFLLYFSRPIGRLEYIIGKLLIPGMYIVAVTTLPALVLYLFAIGLSPNLNVIYATWDIPFRIVLASVFLVVPTAALALMFSSLTHESRFASFAWFAVWALGHGAWFAILISQAIREETAPFDPIVLESQIVQGWSVLSLYNNLGDIQSWVFGFSDLKDAWPGIVALITITVVSLCILFHRVSAPIRV